MSYYYISKLKFVPFESLFAKFYTIAYFSLVPV